MKKIALILTAFLLMFGLAFAVVENLEVPPKQYTGNGVTTDFPITFDYTDESDLTVSFVNDSDGSIDAWTQDALGDQGYTIVSDEVIANTAPDGGRLVIDGETPLTQTLNLKNNRATPAELYESALDKGILATRDVKAILDRAMTAPATADPDVDYTAPEYEAGSYWQWHPTLKELRNADIAGSTTTIGTDVGDIVELVDVGGAVPGWPAVSGFLLTGVTKTTDSDVSGNTWVLDEDDLVSNLDTKVPTQQSVKAYVDVAIPAGSYLMWSTDTPPAGYLECNGASLLRATYPDLFAAIGTLYGTADGTHFNLPDLRGKFLRSWDNGAGIDPDAATRTASAATGSTMTSGDHVGTEEGESFLSHAHVQGTNYDVDNLTDRIPTLTTDSGGRMQQSVGSDSTDANGGNETRPININVMYCIKY